MALSLIEYKYSRVVFPHAKLTILATTTQEQDLRERARLLILQVA
jgi:hypothetical protein